MKIQTACALILSCGLAACATQSDDPFDDLPSYDDDTGAGKFDDPNCTDVTYRAFVKDYLASKVQADANPCPNGNDASYRLWAYAVKTQLEPMEDRYFDAIRQRQNGGSSPETVVAAGTLDSATRTTLHRLSVVKPKNAGKVGIGAWTEYLYQPALQSSTIAVGVIGRGSPWEQRPREVTSFEAEWLGYIEEARPNVVAAGGWAIWWDTASEVFHDVRNDVAADAAQKAIDQALLGRLEAAVPASTFDADGAAFQGEITQSASDDYASPTPDVWQQALAFNPKAGGTLSYKTWAKAFVSVAELFNDGSHSEAQSKLLGMIIAARPCASGSDVDTLVARLKTGLVSAGNDGAGRPLADDAVPVACAAPMP